MFSAVNGGHDTIFGGEFGLGIGDQIVITDTGGTVNNLADLQALANLRMARAFPSSARRGTSYRPMMCCSSCKSAHERRVRLVEAFVGTR